MVGAGYLTATDAYCPCVQRKNARNDAQKSGLPAAGRPEHADDFPFFHLQTDAVKHLSFSVFLFYIINFKYGLHTFSSFPNSE